MIRRTWLRAFLTPVLLCWPVASFAQGGLAAPWDSVGSTLKAPGALTAGYYRYNLPRRDLIMRIGDVTVAPALALGAWVGFSGPSEDASMMGDLVLTGAELKPVLAELARNDIDVTAIHNHVVTDSPQLTYVHFHAQGNAVDLARRVDRAVSATATPRPVAAATSQPVTIDTALVFRTLGMAGRAQGTVAQLSLVLIDGRVTMHGRTVVPAMGYGSPINVQMVSATRAVATGDLAVLGRAVDPVLDALASSGITATAVHTHLIDEQPAIYYIHFWADGEFPDVLRGLRAAVDAAR